MIKNKISIVFVIILIIIIVISIIHYTKNDDKNINDKNINDKNINDKNINDNILNNDKHFKLISKKIKNVNDSKNISRDTNNIKVKNNNTIDFKNSQKNNINNDQGLFMGDNRKTLYLSPLVNNNSTENRITGNNETFYVKGAENNTWTTHEGRKCKQQPVGCMVILPGPDIKSMDQCKEAAETTWMNEYGPALAVSYNTNANSVDKGGCQIYGDFTTPSCISNVVVGIEKKESTCAIKDKKDN